MPSNIKNLAQKRAKFAYQEVKKISEWTGEDADKRKEFKAHVKDVPMMIKTNGLAAAYAFVFSKMTKYKDYKAISEISKKWLVNEQKVFQTSDLPFHEKLVRLDRNQYRRSTREILALFTWLKRYADGMIKSS